MKKQILTSLPELSIQDLEEIKASVIAEIANRQIAAAPICFAATIIPGNTRAGAKAWAKRLTGLDLTKTNGYALLGDFWRDSAGPKPKTDTYRYEGALPEGNFLVICGRGGSWKNRTDLYLLARVKNGAQIDLEYGYQKIKAQNLELVADSTEEITQAGVAAHPELAKFVGRPLGAIALELREAGF